MFNLSKDDIGLIKESFSENMSIDEVASMMNLDLSDTACKSILEGIKLEVEKEGKGKENTVIPYKDKSKKVWTEEDHNNLRVLFLKQLSDKEIARKMNCSADEVTKELKKIGLNRRKKPLTENDIKETNRKIFGLNVGKKRHKAGLTLIQLDEKCGFAKGTCGQYERGYYYPPYDRLLLICKVLKVSEPKRLFVDEEAFFKQYGKDIENENNKNVVSDTDKKHTDLPFNEKVEEKRNDEVKTESCNLTRNGIALAEKSLERKALMEEPKTVEVKIEDKKAENFLTGLSKENVEKLERIAEKNGITVPLVLNLVISQMKEDLEIKLIGLF